MTTNLRTLHRILAVIVLATLAGSLAGCSTAAKPRGGQTSKAARAALAAIPGVTDAEVGVDDNMSGFSHTYDTDVSVTLAPGYRVADPSEFLSFLVRTAWSVNDKKPTSLVDIAITGSTIDLPSLAVQAGWMTETQADNAIPLDGNLVLIVNNEPAKSKLGAWPGKVPTLPDGVLVKK
jgi:hypothetical protein